MALPRNGAMEEARAFGNDVVHRLDRIEEGISDANREIIQDEFATVRNRAAADANGDVEIAAVTIPAGAAWIVDRLSVVAVADITTPGLYLDSVGNENLIEIPYFINGGSPLQATFACGWAMRGPAKIMLSLGGQTEDDMIFTMAMVRMLGGYQ